MAYEAADIVTEILSSIRGLASLVAELKTSRGERRLTSSYNIKLAQLRRLRDSLRAGCVNSA